MMNVIESILLLLAIIITIWSTITDFTYGKIFNKMLLLIFTIGIVGDIVLYGFYQRQNIIGFLSNLGVTIAIAITFYIVKVWAAGDAKLMVVVVFLMPYTVYDVNKNQIFPAFLIFATTFASAYIYIILESIVLFIQNRSVLNGNIRCFTRKRWKHILINYFVGFSLIAFLNPLYFLIFKYTYFENINLFLIINFFILSLFFEIVKEKWLFFVGLIIFILGLGISVYLLIVKKQGLLDIESLFTVLIVILIRYFVSYFNYKEIDALQVKIDMVLSYETILMFLTEKRKGLPLITDETTKSRISEIDAAAIRDWAKEKYPTPKIKIVRLMPFAIFIMLGMAITMFIGRGEWI